MDFVTSALLASWAAIALLAFVVAGLIRQVHHLSRAGAGRSTPPQRAGIEPGRPAPGIGELVDGGSGAVLLFLSDTCPTCEDVLAAASDWAEREGGDQGNGPAIRALYADASVTATGSSAVPVLAGRVDLFEAYDALATPYAVIVDTTGRVARSEPVGSPSALLELLDSGLPGRVRST